MIDIDTKLKGESKMEKTNRINQLVQDIEACKCSGITLDELNHLNDYVRRIFNFEDFEAIEALGAFAKKVTEIKERKGIK